MNAVYFSFFTKKLAASLSELHFNKCFYIIICCLGLKKSELVNPLVTSKHIKVWLWFAICMFVSLRRSWSDCWPEHVCSFRVPSKAVKQSGSLESHRHAQPFLIRYRPLLLFSRFSHKQRLQGVPRSVLTQSWSCFRFNHTTHTHTH